MYCPSCGKEIADQQAFCQFCGGAMPQHPSAQPPGRGKTPWEDEATQWTFRGLAATLKSSLFHPSEFFRRMNVTGGMTAPLVYAVITGMAGIMLFDFWQIVLRESGPAFLPSQLHEAAGGDLLSRVGMGIVAVIMPFLVIGGIFIAAGLLHLLLLTVRGAKNGYEATFRAVAYAYGTNILMAIPFCGLVLAAIWNIVVVIIGLKEAHGTTGGKAMFVVLFPLILCCASAVLFALLVLGTVASSFGTMPSQPWK